MTRDVALSEQLVGEILARYGRRGIRLDPDDNFFEAGLTSVALASALTDLHAIVPDVTLVDLFTFPTLRALTDELLRRLDPRANTARQAMPWERG